MANGNAWLYLGSGYTYSGVDKEGSILPGEITQMPSAYVQQAYERRWLDTTRSLR